MRLQAALAEQVRDEVLGRRLAATTGHAYDRPGKSVAVLERDCLKCELGVFRNELWQGDILARRSYEGGGGSGPAGILEEIMAVALSGLEGHKAVARL
ncbi:MAG: hypothetical protein ACQKBV_03445 [Puniceicoccales bacterium]